ncbi:MULTISPECIES: histidine phosphatase family protein [Cyanophyceae]|uniref:histidine phosphatase family protein n=1 Tax=Cyanophyceae TaxID=3028117 RepID=UPI0016867E4F|nr:MULTISPECIES: histidine phosphatase family protein [Cyanophyceae]MBD1917539.1 histidine phosphatase family protein [Phormidium sp. FACHB-77]MBD2029586.1 histidine phosphatase family protein [Phormidium sp. FACHB-322]MBD2050847.1 histidine phosphatase family protein [Leptolyngbya sp. FACHB-60]
MKTRVIIVRHGQSTYNQLKLIQGHCDESELTPAGEAQALQVGQALVGIPFDGVWASPLKRARKTAEIIAAELRTEIEGLTPAFTDDLKEICLPLWEGVAFSEAEAQHPETFHQWRTDPANLVMAVPQADGTTVDFYPIRELYQQAARFWQGLLAEHQGKTLLVVAHSAINRALISTAIGLGPEYFNNLHQANCSISVLNFAAGWGSPVQVEAMNLTSHMGAPLPEMRRGHKGPRLLLVRHGETEWNRQGRFQGQIDVPLNDNGRAQGAKAADFLKPVAIDAAYTSFMARPKETAEIILQHHPGLTLHSVNELREISHGEWEGLYEAEIETNYPGMLEQWQSAPETVQMPGGENLEQVWLRSIAAWKEIVAAHSGGDTVQTILVVAHDAVNKALLCHVLGMGPEFFWRFKQGNGAVSVIDYPDGIDSAPVLVTANVTIHLSGSVLDKTAAGAL